MNRKIRKIINKINQKIITQKEIRAVTNVLKRGILSQADVGPMVRKFQSLFATYLHRKYAFTTSSGTTALHATVSALHLKRGDEIIIPALANIADVSVLLQEGIVPVFADVTKDTFCIDPKDVIKKVNTRTKAIIAVHMYGQPAEINELLRISRKYNLILIEDCAQAIGAEYRNRLVGSFGDIACFSFYQTKNITCGEGGMIVTDKPEYAERIESILNSGLKRNRNNIDNYDYNTIGYNYRLTEIQASIGIEQLKRLNKINEIRRINTKIYQEELKNIDFVFQKEKKETKNVYFYLTGLLPITLSALRDRFIRELRKNGVPVKKLYPVPLHKIDLLRRKIKYSCPVAEDITKRLFNFYVNPGLTQRDISNFCEVIKRTYESLLL